MPYGGLHRGGEAVAQNVQALPHAGAKHECWEGRFAASHDVVRDNLEKCSWLSIGRAWPTP